MTLYNWKYGLTKKFMSLLYLLLRFPTSSSLVWPEHRQDMTCLIRLLETAETNKTLMSIFLEIKFSAVCGFDRKMWLSDLESSIDQKGLFWMKLNVNILIH